MRQTDGVLTRLRQHAESLDRAALMRPDRVPGGPDATALTHAAADAERAASLLGSIDADPGAVQSVRAAARLLHGALDGTPRIDHALDTLRAATTTTQEAVIARIATLAPDDARALMHSLLETDDASLTRGDWAMIEALLASDPDGRVLRGPRTLSASLSFSDVAAANVAGRATQHEDIVASRRYLAAWRGTQIPLEQHAQIVREIVAKQPAELSLEEWRTLGALLDVPATSSPLRGPRLLGPAPLDSRAWKLAVERPGGVQVLSVAELERYFAAWRIADLPEAHRASMARDVMSIEPSLRTPEHWKTLGAVLDTGVDAALLPGPVALLDAPPLDLLAQLGVENFSLNAGFTARVAHRYHAAWLGTDVPIEQRADVVRGIIATEPSRITAAQWRTLGTLLDLPPGSGVPDGPRYLPGAGAFATSAHANSLGSTEFVAATERFLAAWRGTDIPADQHESIVREIVAKDRDQITAREWRTLGALLDLDVDANVLHGPPGLDARPPFAKLAWEFALNPAPAPIDVERVDDYLTAWRVAGLPADQQRSLAREIAMREPAQLASDDWRRLWSLLEIDPTLAPTPDAATELIRLARGHSTNPPASGKELARLDRHFTDLRLALDPGYRARLDDAYEDVASGSASADAGRLVLADRASLEQSVAGRPSDERVRFALLVAGSEHGATVDGAGTALRMLRSTMDRYVGLGAGLESIRQQTIELIDQNLLRIDGQTPEGAVAGYSYHPEYAQIGRIRSNLELLESALLTRTSTADRTIVW